MAEAAAYCHRHRRDEHVHDAQGENPTPGDGPVGTQAVVSTPGASSQRQQHHCVGRIDDRPVVRPVHHRNNEHSDVKIVKPDRNGSYVPQTVRIRLVQHPVGYPKGAGHRCRASKARIVSQSSRHSHPRSRETSSAPPVARASSTLGSPSKHHGQQARKEQMPCTVVAIVPVRGSPRIAVWVAEPGTKPCPNCVQRTGDNADQGGRRGASSQPASGSIRACVRHGNSPQKWSVWQFTSAKGVRQNLRQLRRVAFASDTFTGMNSQKRLRIHQPHNGNTTLRACG